jgi:hypothetical protein
MSETRYALSVKQPWAALLVAGIKSIEVRTWRTQRRGVVLIHAGKVPDPRPEAWAWITTPALRQSTTYLGGIVGIAELCDCIPYATRSRFEADRGRHLNAPDWFQTRGLFGFEFRHPRTLEFLPCPGQTFFFPVTIKELPI